ncbi:hypothetical protein CSC62_01110 [Pseudoxanthomonas jiangsuensis]|uniref:hypothetical protein n=1 Tax=Pseudoxanthomonas jiangsuensis TaxID=619688 RepID=UPI00139181D2|nr:hypothetical protein [Pseudoxanthomonas jiangsuensis]KAF1699531.1 hypothetical protein CSC62_01110 [Pseudoxanthomonas jiangsuensis]
MSILKTVAVGVLGFLAYQAWQRRKVGTDAHALPDTGGRTPPHGDTIRIHTDEIEPLPPTTAQSSRGFGGDDY